MIQISTSKDYYSSDLIAKGYDRERFQSNAGKLFDSFEKSVVLSFLPKNPSGKKILDAGAGSGRFTIEIAKMGFKVTACDYSEAMLSVINTKIHKLNLINEVQLSKQDITCMTFDDNEFDYICSLRVMVNLDTEENAITGLYELIRTCKPGGLIVVEFVNPLSVAWFGPKKGSMISMKKVHKILNRIPNITLENCFGRRIISQTIFEKSPHYLLKILDNFDSRLSSLLPLLCVRTYYIISKH